MTPLNHRSWFATSSIGQAQPFPGLSGLFGRDLRGDVEPNHDLGARLSRTAGGWSPCLRTTDGSSEGSLWPGVRSLEDRRIAKNALHLAGHRRFLHVGHPLNTSDFCDELCLKQRLHGLHHCVGNGPVRLVRSVWSGDFIGIDPLSSARDRSHRRTRTTKSRRDHLVHAHRRNHCRGDRNFHLHSLTRWSD